VAIVQISKIQHRRGREREGTGMPQLASGEFGWAIDTQKLYIGNGSVAEGSPYVGNTRILTEHDTPLLLDYVARYIYRKDDIQTGADGSSAISRSLQSRLDDFVSVAAFGANGDGAIQSAAIQRAIDQHYLKNKTNNQTTVTNRVIIHIPPGTYTIDGTIFLPPYVTLRGAGKNKTILVSEDVTVFQTINSSSLIGNYNPSMNSYDNQPRNIHVEGMTIISRGPNPALILDSCRDSIFENLELIGSWLPGEQNDSQCAIRLTSTSDSGNAEDMVVSANNRFLNIEFSGFDTIIESDDDIVNNHFVGCTFKNARYGIVFGENSLQGTLAQSRGPSFNTIENSVFDKITYQALWVAFGKHNVSKNNRYLLVGNDDGSAEQTLTSIIKFDDDNNISDTDYFQRSTEIFYANPLEQYTTVRYIPEIEGKVRYENRVVNTTYIGFRSEFQNIIKIPAPQLGIVYIDYIYRDEAFTREGVIEILCNLNTNTVVLNESYQYNGESGFSRLLEFKAELFDLDSDGTKETIMLLAKNTIPGLTNDRFSYTIRLKS
jgi:hypothetical protein